MLDLGKHMFKKTIVSIAMLFAFTPSLAQSSSNIALMPSKQIKAVLFDTFGTVVDWRGTMVSEFSSLFKIKKISNIDAEAFVEAWVMAYADKMDEISENKAPFATVDALNKRALNKALKQHHIFNHFTIQERKHMWLMWHRLNAWPDSVKGLNQLKKHFIIGTLTNGNVRLVIDMSKKARLNWDVIFSGELIKRYKPDPIVYQSAAGFLNLKPSEIILVASHKYDLRAAQQLGFKTAYLFRPKEFKTIHKDQMPIKNEFDFTVTGIDKLSLKLRTNFNG